MQKNNLYETALTEQASIVTSIKSVSAKILAEKSGVDLERIYRIRKGKAGDLTWPEVQAMRRAMRIMFNHA